MKDDNILNSVYTNTVTVNASNPWPGLEAYREADQEFFHGRRQEIDELYLSVIRAPLTVFFGQSGLGKTSLLQAGLFTHLRKKYILPVYIRLDFSNNAVNLISQVKQIITSEVARFGLEAPAEKNGETLWEFFHRRNADFWDKSNRIMLPLLVFDQFEEIFTLGRSDPDKLRSSESFLTELGDLIEGRPPKELKELMDANPEDASEFNFTRHYYKVLLSLREDYIPDLEGLREQIPSIIHNRVRLYAMNGSAAFEVVIHARHLIEEQVAKKVVRFVAAIEDSNLALEKLEIEPALLSVVCRELNNKRQQLNEPLISEDLLEGSQDEILNNFYERCVSDMAPEVRAFVEEKLLTVSGYRDSIAVENAINIPGVTSDAIMKLVNRRLIRKEERSGMERLELTHDLLTGVTSSSRNRRHQVEDMRKRQEEVTTKERQQRLEERARSARTFRWLWLVMSFLFIAATVSTIFAFIKVKSAKIEAIKAVKAADEAKKATQIAIMQADSADQEREKIRILLQTMEEKSKISTTTHTNDQIMNQIIEKAVIENQIEFGATAEEQLSKTAQKLPTYKFQIFPVIQSVPGDLKSIESIVYYLIHPTFTRQTYPTKSDSNFTVTYYGVGCLGSVTAIINYSDPSRPPSVAKFNMCEILEIKPLRDKTIRDSTIRQRIMQK